ncbi:pyridoxamine 5'-phosphate oxidase family protein [Puniceicoccus vermicola]|uniref:Pyridoxamine 5'-phosphate oxidase family protein n=1 Tax=Puniceicoccus vermicola TaxID=388746 RepID=A0A7X1B0P1_9BACT|nr:pyridoxamine 5'-phosphate oxidase family protein [Puniceicoccus vermicola]MBC2603475.1 pyridoxamine 5'-phosphate oxidase family protein [Puniceicoccus vermicola]
MSKLSEEVLTAVEKTIPMGVATADVQGRPNLVYVSLIKAIDSDTLVVGDCAFSKTKANLAENPVMSALVMNPDTKRAFQIKCRAEEVTEGERFESVAAWAQSLWPNVPLRAAYYLHVEEVFAGAERIA